LSIPQLRHFNVTDPAAPNGPVCRLAYWDWPCAGEVEHPQVVVCVHGLSRQGRDFDVLARALSVRARVLAIDLAGRGHSDRLTNPADYQIPTYVSHMAQWLTAIRRQTPEAVVDWVGTSLGGLVGMILASQPGLAPRRLVLNDVGPAIERESLHRISSYIDRNPSFPSQQAAFDYLASISQGFGPHSPEEWAELSAPMLREREGRWWLHHDPAIGMAFRKLVEQDEAALQAQLREGEALLWATYDKISSPTLLLRGAESDLLTKETAGLMGVRGPRARCIEFAGVGHAPTLRAAEQVAAVRDFLFAD